MTQLYNVILAVCGRVETYRATTGLHYLGNMDFLFPPTLSWLGSDVACSCGCIQSGTTKIIYQQDEPLNSKIKPPRPWLWSAGMSPVVLHDRATIKRHLCQMCQNVTFLISTINSVHTCVDATVIKWWCGQRSMFYFLFYFFYLASSHCFWLLLNSLEECVCSGFLWMCRL